MGQFNKGNLVFTAENKAEEFIYCLLSEENVILKITDTGDPETVEIELSMPRKMEQLPREFLHKHLTDLGWRTSDSD